MKAGLAHQVQQILELFRDEFPANDIMAKAVDRGTYWQWFAEVPFEVPPILEHALKDALADKWFDRITVNPYHEGYTRVSITVMKGETDESHEG
uniref:Uncharacterized protein n=1 Tax=Pseudomonas phage RVTF4 TaxID=3236931 RepID=A0AB39CC81_9VIRU